MPPTLTIDAESPDFDAIKTGIANLTIELKDKDSKLTPLEFKVVGDEIKCENLLKADKYSVQVKLGDKPYTSTPGEVDITESTTNYTLKLTSV
jgi:hypothetical protein